jgi:hypothetical protein
MIYFLTLPLFLLSISGCKHQTISSLDTQNELSSECMEELTDFVSLYWVIESDGTLAYHAQLLDLGSTLSGPGRCIIGTSYDTVLGYFGEPHYTYSIDGEYFIYYEIDLGCLENNEPGTLCYFYSFRFDDNLKCLSNGLGSKLVQ